MFPPADSWMSRSARPERGKGLPGSRVAFSQRRDYFSFVRVESDWGERSPSVMRDKPQVHSA